MEKVGPWSVPVALDDILETGLHREIVADPETRAALAAVAGVREIPQLSAIFDLTRQSGGIHVLGRIEARIGQTCVVTLDPIENTIDEQVDVVFAPAAPVSTVSRSHAIEEGEDPPEPLKDGRIDLGMLATEFLLLSIDPYPRKPGAQFAAPEARDDGDHPFAGLEALKTRLGGSQS